MGTVVWRNSGYDRDGSHDARDDGRRGRRRDTDGDEGYNSHRNERRIDRIREEEEEYRARTERKRDRDRRREDHRSDRKDEDAYAYERKKRDRSGGEEDGSTALQSNVQIGHASTVPLLLNPKPGIEEEEEEGAWMDRKRERDGGGKRHRSEIDYSRMDQSKATVQELAKDEPAVDVRRAETADGVIRSERLVQGKRAIEKPIEQAAGRSGGVYVPPFKLAQMMRDVKDKSSAQYQRMTWDALRKSINGLVNKVNSSNIKNILPELFGENLIRGRGLFARSCMKSQMASPAFTHVFAALVAVVNTKFPELGELLLKRIILQLRRAFKRNDKPVLLAAAKFIAHLVNQQVAHEILALELLTILLDKPTDDSVEVAVGFVKECGAILQDLSPQGLHGIFERFRGILHEGEIDKRVQFMIEGLFAIRKTRFQGFPAVTPELDLVEQEDQITHELSLEDELDQETGLDIFKLDPDFEENEKKYDAFKKEILGDESDGGEGDDTEKAQGEEDESEEDSDDEDEEEREARMQIQDETETNLVNLRRTIYLTIMSSVDFEEAGHKLLKIKLEPGQEMELCVMLLECCSQERTYLRYYGLLGQRFCMVNRIYQENFDDCFVKQYSMIHRLETNKLRNVAKFFAHLLGTDALPWQSLAYIRLTEEDTTSSSRIFIKILFQELSEHLGLRKLNERLSDPEMQDYFDGVFPKDNPKNTRFAINFFTSIGLGGLTDSLREYLKNMPRLIMNQHKPVESESDAEDLGGDSETSGGGSSSESEPDSSDSESSERESDDSQDEKERKRRKRK
ncbi:hypothetical protein CY35_19G049300 [Sphagnum magellanicum]|nr:hypothetical protein CY35_19G049300 [Sphagnum magellanicum]